LAWVADQPFTRAGRRASTKRRRTAGRRVAFAVLVIIAGATAAAVWAAERNDREISRIDPSTSSAAPRTNTTAPAATRATHLIARPAGSLPSAVQDGAAARVGSSVVLLGGLDSAITSTSDVRLIANGRAHTIGHLPVAFHDGAAVTIGRSVYEFGGGDGIHQLDQILRVDPRTGSSREVGRLPAPSSDQAGTGLKGTAYIVGGYTGARWLDTIVSWSPARGAHVAAHLPSAVRYAAVAAAGGKIVIAGGSLPSGTASSAIEIFDPASSSVRRIGSLPSPTTHASAAAIGNEIFVIGGRGARSGTPTRRIVAIDVATHRVRVAGRLGTALSDSAAIGLGTRILVAGGRTQAPTARLTKLVEAPLRARAAPHPVKSTRPVTRGRINVYAYDGANALSPTVRGMPARVYVPNSASNTVDVIDQRTFKIVAHYPVGLLPQHVTPSYDLKTLWVDNDVGNSLTPVSPFTGRPTGKPVPVVDPYNLYFTPGGRFAIVVAERMHRLDFRFAHTMKLHKALNVPCRGVDHMDFSADGRYLLASCEFSGQMVKIDVRRERVVGVLNLRDGVPQDVKLSPDGRIFYVADLSRNGVWEIDGRRMKVLGFIHTGAGAHGLYPSRNGKLLYVTNRNEGTISVLSFATRKVVATWNVGGSPDMGGVSADGRVLWLSARYNAQVYAISTKNGRVLARISVGYGPHGVCVWPQPGRYSLGHTGILR